MQNDGYRSVIDSLDQNEIGLSNRAQIANNYANYFGRQKTVFVSVHVNAAGSDGKWRTATGWESHIAKNASENSKKLANIFWEEASKINDIKLRRPLPTQNYWENNYTVLVKTICPAILTESMFQDCKKDVEYLQSEEGFNKLVQLHVDSLERYVDELVGVRKNEPDS